LNFFRFDVMVTSVVGLISAKALVGGSFALSGVGGLLLGAPVDQQVTDDMRNRLALVEAGQANPVV
jgi:hypothetical protein